jgi:hypothetical protein
VIEKDILAPVATVYLYSRIYASSESAAASPPPAAPTPPSLATCPRPPPSAPTAASMQPPAPRRKYNVLKVLFHPKRQSSRHLKTPRSAITMAHAAHEGSAFCSSMREDLVRGMRSEAQLAAGCLGAAR